MASEKNKKKKPFLVAGLILLFVALFVGIGFLATGSIVFARNALAIFALGGAGVGLGTAFNKGIGAVIDKVSSKSQNRTRNRNRNNNRTQNMEDIPEEEYEEEYEEDYEEEYEDVQDRQNTRRGNQNEYSSEPQKPKDTVNRRSGR